MIKFVTLVMIVALRLLYHPLYTETDVAPFATPSPLPSSATINKHKPQLISFRGSLNDRKVLLQWVVKENETTNQFEVQKSTDGKNFVMAALVFSTDIKETGNYQFYEDAGNKKIFYRIKLITRDQKTEYSSIIEIDPAKPEQSENPKTNTHVYYC